MNYFFRSSRVYVVAFFFCLILAQQSHADELGSTVPQNVQYGSANDPQIYVFFKVIKSANSGPNLSITIIKQ